MNVYIRLKEKNNEHCYDYGQKMYGKKGELLFTDTDGFTYQIKNENFYKDLWEDNFFFHFSSYSKD